MDEIYDIYELLNEAADRADDALWKIRQLPVGEEYDKNELICEAEALLESLSKAVEEVGANVYAMEYREIEEMKRDSMNW